MICLGRYSGTEEEKIQKGGQKLYKVVHLSYFHAVKHLFSHPLYNEPSLISNNTRSVSLYDQAEAVTITKRLKSFQTYI